MEEGEGIKHFLLLFNQEKERECVSMCTHEIFVGVMCVSLHAHMFCCVHGGMHCTWVSIRIYVHGVCACLSGWVYVASVHVLWHLRGPMRLTYTLGDAGPDRSWALRRKRVSSLTSTPRPPVSASSFSPPLGALFFILSVSLAAPSPSSWQRLGLWLSFPSAPAPNTCSWALDRSCRIRMGKVSEEEGTQARQGLREGQRFSGSLINSI